MEVPILLDFEKKKLGSLHAKLKILYAKREKREKDYQTIKKLETKLQSKAAVIYKKLSCWQRTQVARHSSRPYTSDYIQHIFKDFIEIHGDRLYKDDRSILAGLAVFNGRSVVVVGHQKGRNTQENIEFNFGMPNPEGYRKALRLFKLADKFSMPIITFIDTPGAYPGIGAEKRGQASAIATNLQQMFSIKVPIIAIVIGEGGSGGALALSVADHIHMLENSVYSVISPESCASILWRDASYKKEAAEALKNDAKTAFRFGIVDSIIEEVPGGAHRDSMLTAKHVGEAIEKSLKTLSRKSVATLLAERIEKFAKVGEFL